METSGSNSCRQQDLHDQVQYNPGIIVWGRGGSIVYTCTVLVAWGPELIQEGHCLAQAQEERIQDKQAASVWHLKLSTWTLNPKTPCQPGWKSINTIDGSESMQKDQAYFFSDIF